MFNSHHDVLVASPRNDGKSIGLVCVHGFFSAVKNAQMSIMMFGTRLCYASGEIPFGFCGMSALFDLLHVTFLSFVRFGEVFGDGDNHESRKHGKVAMTYG
jgi:hypothetical protein